MKDYFGVEIKVGDKVVYTYYDYSSFIKGEVVKINPKTVRVLSYGSEINKEPKNLIVRLVEEL